LVARYIDLVYSTALRKVSGDAHLAQDVTQMVFLQLVRKARRIPRNVPLGGWLHGATCNVAATVRRTERRRQKREEEALQMNALQNDSAGRLEQVAPILDDAISQLPNEDRVAILLRFFERRDFRSIGSALGSTEDAARMRVNRALQKLELILKRRGASISAAALGAALTAEAVAAAPAGLAASVAGSALAGVAAAGGIASSAFTIMVMSKLKLGIISAVVIGGLVVSLVVQHQSLARLREDNRSLQQQVEELRDAKNQLAQVAVDQDELAKRRRDQSELLRLRAEVTTLRKATQAATLQPLPAAPLSPGASAAPDTVLRVIRLEANVRTQVGSGQTLVTGGWVSELGKRTLVLVTPRVEGENADKVGIETKMIEVPEAVLSNVGLESLLAEGTETSLHKVIPADQAGTLLKTLQSSGGTQLIAQSSMSTPDGGQCQVQVTDEHDQLVVDGQKLSIGPLVDIFPVISGDKSTVDITLRTVTTKLTSKAK
jgi:RNA polymerase sigma factor (sigma-70 family)